MSARLCTLKEFINLAYNDPADGIGDPTHENPHSYRKLSYHSKGRAVLRQIAKELGLGPGTYEIRSNKGGVAVAGEIILHGDRIYISFGEGIQFMYRACNKLDDYTGGSNHWIENLYDFPRACEQIKRVALMGT